jgi:5-hydroxyisourate hydrolase
VTSHLTTHVLDAAAGAPAAGVAVVLDVRGEGGWTPVATGITDDDGRISDLGPERLASGTYRLTFAVGDYQAARGVDSFYPEVTVICRIDATETHYHVPILLSPFAYSTYRGS